MDAFTPTIEAVRDLIERALRGCDPRPPVFIGAAGTNNAYAAVVFETPDDVGITSRVTSVPTMGGARGPYALEFSVGAQMWAVRKDPAEAGRMVNGWFTRVMDALARDKTLGGLCETASIAYARGGSVPKDRAALAAIDLSIRVKSHFTPCSDQ